MAQLPIVPGTRRMGRHELHGQTRIVTQMGPVPRNGGLDEIHFRDHQALGQMDPVPGLLSRIKNILERDVRIVTEFAPVPGNLLNCAKAP